MHHACLQRYPSLQLLFCARYWIPNMFYASPMCASIDPLVSLSVLLQWSVSHSALIMWLPNNIHSLYRCSRHVAVSKEQMDMCMGYDLAYRFGCVVIGHETCIPERNSLLYGKKKCGHFFVVSKGSDNTKADFVISNYQHLSITIKGQVHKEQVQFISNQTWQKKKEKNVYSFSTTPKPNELFEKSIQRCDLTL